MRHLRPLFCSRARDLLGLLGLVAALLMALSASADQIRIGDVRGNELSRGETATVRSLIESQLLQRPDVALVDASARGQVSTLRAQVDRWGDGLILIMELEKPDGTRISRNSKATEFGQVDIAIANLVDSLLAQSPDPAAVAPAPPPSQPAPTRRQGRTTVGGYLGPAWGFTGAMESQGTLYDFGLGFGWEFERYLIELRPSFLVGPNDDDIFAFMASLGWDYFWLRTTSAGLYSGLEGGIGYVRESLSGNEENTTGFLFGFSTGVLLLRDANVNIDLRFRVRILSERINGQVPVVGGVAMGLRF